MKISLEWLAQYLQGPLDAPLLAETLTHGGLPVEVIEPFGDDTVIDVEVTSNRSDCLSYLGVARELAALLNRTFTDIRIDPAESASPASQAVRVAIDAPALCPHYTARVIRGVKIGPSPAWLSRRLEAMGLRSINNIVDVTNYVLFETGQPLHAFDFDKIEGRQIIVRPARAGEKLISLDGHERALRQDMLVIADARKPVALAGVMGGQESEVSAGTVNVLLESARFDPLSIRRTARALSMKSDSSYRFERGLDPTLVHRAGRRAAQLILEVAGGELLAGCAEAGAENHTPKKLSLRLAKLQQVLGVGFPVEQVVDALRRLGLSPSSQQERVDVTIPSHRLDLGIEVDLVEEVARVIGYEKVPMRDTIEVRVTAPQPELISQNLIRHTLIAAGYYESLTVGFVSDLLASDFTPADASGLMRTDPLVRKADGRLRPSVLPGLLESVRRNEANGLPGAKLYEIGSTFWLDAAGAPVERRTVALVGSTDLREVRGAVERVLSRLDDTRRVQVVPDRRAGFSASACGRIEWNGVPIGHLGRIDKAVASKLSLREAPCAAELQLDPLLAGHAHVPQLRPLPKFPSVRRDLSLIVPETLPFAQIESLVNGLSLDQLESMEYVTTYRGKPLEKGSKSVTITLVFRSPSTTLTSEQVEGAVQKAILAAREKLGATLRM